MPAPPDSAGWLSQLIDLDFEFVRLDNVLKYVAAVVPRVSIVVDPDVATAGIDLSTRVVDFRGKALPIGGVLEVILGADLAYMPKPGHLLITTLERLHTSLECETYALTPTPHWQELVDIVQRVVNNFADRYVAPWSDEGGAATIEYVNGVLVATQTYRGHQRIVDLLGKLDASGFFNVVQSAEGPRAVHSADTRAEALRAPVPFIPESTHEFSAFLCHAFEDKEAVVEPFADLMEERGLKPWLDDGQVRWGENLVQKIQDGLARSRFTIVFISQAFLRKRRWADSELNAALSMEVGGRPFVLPVLLGLTRDELQARYPLVSAKVYKEIPDYDPVKPVSREVLQPLVEELRRLIGSD